MESLQTDRRILSYTNVALEARILREFWQFLNNYALFCLAILLRYFQISISLKLVATGKW